jgi:hypothetical protein
MSGTKTPFYVMFTDEDGCPSLLHHPAVDKGGSIIWCCCAAFAHPFNYSDACLVAAVLKGEPVTAEAYEAKLGAWSE